MNFTTIYEDRLRFFPETIDITDGKEIAETDGFLFPKLSQLWNIAEAYYKVIHRS